MAAQADIFVWSTCRAHYTGSASTSSSSWWVADGGGPCQSISKSTCPDRNTTKMNSITYLDSILSRSLTTSRSGSGSNTPVRPIADDGNSRNHLSRRASDYSLAREREREKRRIAASLGLTSLDGERSTRKSSKRSSRKSSRSGSARHSDAEQPSGSAEGTVLDTQKQSRRARHSEGSGEPIGLSRHPKSFSEGYGDDDRRARLKRAGSTPAPLPSSQPGRGWSSLWGFGSFLEGSHAAGGSYDGYMRRTLSGASHSSSSAGSLNGRAALAHGRRASTGDASSPSNFSAFAPDALLSEREREDVVDLEGYDPDEDLQPTLAAPPSTPYPSSNTLLPAGQPRSSPSSSNEKPSLPVTPTEQNTSSTKLTSLLFGALNPLTDDYFGPQAAARSAHSKRRASEASEKRRKSEQRSRMGSHASKDSHSEASSSSHGHDLNGGLDSGKSTTTIKADDAKPLDEKTTDVQAIPSHPPPPYGEANGSAASSSATLVSNPVFSPLQRSSSYASEIPVSTHRYSNVLVRGLKNTLAFLKRLILIIILGPYRAYQLAHNDSKDRVAVAAQAHVRAVPVESTTTSVYTNGLADETSSKNEKDTQSVGTLTNEKETEEMVTEDQAAVRAAREAKQDVQATVTRPRASSRLLPNPNPVDPMLAHDRNAKALEQATAEAEAKALRHKQQQQQGRPAVVSRGPNSSLIHHSPKVLVLDLDETLIHSTSRSPTWGALADKSKTRLAVTTGGSLLGLEGLGGVLGLRGQVGVRPHQVEVVLDGRSIIYHVYKRPHVDTFLRKVASWYHVVVFTASVQEYADPVIDWLDQGRGLISARLFRESCTYRSGSYYKNLSLVDADLSRVCLVDNSPASYQINQANGIPIEGWTHDPNDEALLDLLPVLDSLRFASDVRHILGIRGFSDLASRTTNSGRA